MLMTIDDVITQLRWRPDDARIIWWQETKAAIDSGKFNTALNRLATHFGDDDYLEQQGIICQEVAKAVEKRLIDQSL